MHWTEKLRHTIYTSQKKPIFCCILIIVSMCSVCSYSRKNLCTRRDDILDCNLRVVRTRLDASSPRRAHPSLQPHVLVAASGPRRSQTRSTWCTRGATRADACGLGAQSVLEQVQLAARARRRAVARRAVASLCTRERRGTDARHARTHGQGRARRWQWLG